MSRTYRRCPWIFGPEATYVEDEVKDYIARFNSGRYWWKCYGKDFDPEAVAEYERAWYRSSFRDGRLKESARKQGFKNQCKRELRRKNKLFCDDVVADRDWEDKACPIRKEGKAHTWDWW